MSKLSNSKEFSLLIVDRKGKVVIFCEDHQKKLETYRQTRAHFKKGGDYHDLEKEQFQTISKVAFHLWGNGKK